MPNPMYRPVEMPVSLVSVLPLDYEAYSSVDTTATSTSSQRTRYSVVRLPRWSTPSYAYTVVILTVSRVTHFLIQVFSHNSDLPSRSAIVDKRVLDTIPVVTLTTRVQPPHE